ncbi:hypothetical protein ABMA32_03610 [Mesorhizobium sp. VNQ89]|uniref:hypothetical protein n=1 Tax=Mesorhizobium quangtriensis TaxID=3157709 RepID=UPI0032B73487
MEQKRPTNPFDEFTDEEIEAAMASLDAAIEAATGMPAAEYAQQLQRDIDAGKPSPLDDASVHAFLASMKKDFKLAYNQLRSGALS